MSHRAVRRLRRPEDLLNRVDADDNEDSDSDESDDVVDARAGGRFTMMMADDSDSDSDGNDDGESSVSNSRDGGGEEGGSGEGDRGEDGDHGGGGGDRDEKEIDNGFVSTNHKETSGVSKEDDDLDKLLDHFKHSDKKQFSKGESKKSSTPEESASLPFYFFLIEGIDKRDFDIDYASKATLMAGVESERDRGRDRGRNGRIGGPGGRGRGRHGSRKVPIFGPPRDDWPRPPNYVAGGIGMKTYQDIGADSPSIPWPYNTMDKGDERRPHEKICYKFVFSDEYRRDVSDYGVIAQSGDANSLCMFVAHHPFITDALCQLSDVLYQTNQQRHGLSMLKRALWVFDNASLISFLNTDGRGAFVDYELEENHTFFRALFCLVRVAFVAGLMNTAFAVSSLLLSFDPLRDPMNQALCLDHFALNVDGGNQFVVDAVESRKVEIAYHDADHPEGWICPLLECPNWAYSYALALFRLQKDRVIDDDDAASDPDIALQNAILRFPSVVGLLLTKNNIDTSSRSMQTDWPSVISFLQDLVNAAQRTNSSSASISTDPLVRSCTVQSVENAINIFVQLNHSIWKDDNVLRWLYRTVEDMMTKAAEEEEEEGPPSMSTTPSFVFSPALMRFAQADPADFENKFTTMPADANPLMPDTVDYALTVNLQRPRLVRGRRGPADADGFHVDNLEGLRAAMEGGNLFGPPLNDIDLDEPLLNVYLQAMMPWNRAP